MKVMRVNEAADYLGLSVSALNKWRVTGKGPKFVKLGRAVAYRVSDLHEWLEKQAKQSTSQEVPPWSDD
ncbi:MAG: helix-turn-helix domain-containing protein [Erythrobacter sp.]|uniref:helix-turn-helix transcriptional regulator n=1 Tax=Parasphingorhabdus sp. TaxID=2709688 RepID=UPI00326E3D8C